MVRISWWMAADRGLVVSLNRLRRLSLTIQQRESVSTRCHLLEKYLVEKTTLSAQSFLVMVGDTSIPKPIKVDGAGMPRILLCSAYLAPLILQSLGEKVEVPEHHKAYPPLPEPYKITQERLERCRELSTDWMISDLEIEEKSAELGK